MAITNDQKDPAWARQQAAVDREFGDQPPSRPQAEAAPVEQRVMDIAVEIGYMVGYDFDVTQKVAAFLNTKLRTELAAERAATEKLQNEQIYGFYEYEYPFYCDGAHAMELCSLVEPKELNQLVTKLKETETRLKQVEAELREHERSGERPAQVHDPNNKNGYCLGCGLIYYHDHRADCWLAKLLPTPPEGSKP